MGEKIVANFNEIINRSGTSSLKYDARKAYFGTEDVIPLWVADMDFPAPEAVTNALIQRASHPIYGYTLYPGSLFIAMQNWFLVEQPLLEKMEMTIKTHCFSIIREIYLREFSAWQQ